MTDEELFHAALAKPPAKRAGFLEQARAAEGAQHTAEVRLAEDMLAQADSPSLATCYLEAQQLYTEAYDQGRGVETVIHEVHRTN